MKNAFGRQSWANSEKPSKVTIPTRGTTLSRLVFAEMQKQRVTYAELEWRSSVLVSTIKSWRNEKAPSLPSIEATLGALGWALVPVPCAERVPEWVRNELDSINERWGREEPLLHRLLASACLAPILVERPDAPADATEMATHD